ncbi:MAG: hypothetical protein HGB32_03590 [Geobacteraceae bacterium]|nr:hypothetical protein [Geobacteraceae bacterium]NTW79215.1 hypothetical protein [Geobacteraceae bacterium]
MLDLLDRYHDLLRWGAHFCMLPLHWMASVGHQYSTATTIGSAVLVLYAAESVRHARKFGFSNHE